MTDTTIGFRSTATRAWSFDREHAVVIMRAPTGMSAGVVDAEAGGATCVRSHSRSSACGLDKEQTDREKLFAEFAPLVRRLMRQYGQDAELRKDLQGEIYWRFCSFLDAYDPARGVPLRPYLVRQLTASIYTYVRHDWRLRKREVALEGPEGCADLSPSSVDPTPEWDATLTQQQVLARLPEAMARLPKRQRQIVIWRYYEEKSFEEIAELLGIQPATARSLLRHGINNMRKQIL